MGESITSRLGRRVRELRRARGLSQVELAHAARMSRVFVGDVENGQKSASVDTLDKLANALGVEVAELFKGKKRENASRTSARERLLGRIAMLVENAPDAEIARFEEVADSFFAP